MGKYYVIIKIGKDMKPVYCTSNIGEYTKDVYSAVLFLTKEEAKGYLEMYYKGKEDSTFIIEKVYCTYKN